MKTLSKNNLIFISTLMIMLLMNPIMSSANTVPWTSETYRAFAQEDVWYGTIDENFGPPLSVNASVSESCMGGFASADSQITSTSMFVSAGGSSGGCGANHSTAIAEFEGTYTATYSLFNFVYDYTSGNGTSGGIYIENLTTSTVLLDQSFGASDSLSVQTSIGNDIYVKFDITSANCCNSGGSATLNYNMAVAPEPISSILFVAGGTILGLRRFRKKITNK